MTTPTSEPTQPLAYYDLSSLCRYMTRPVLMTGIFRDILRRHFLEGPYIEDPKIRHLIWQETETTGILIESVYRWRPELTEKRPAVMIRRNAYQNQKRGIGDVAQGNPVDEFGHPHFSTFWQGSHTLFCLAGEGNQADSLASEVQRHLTQFGPVIQRHLGLKQFQVQEVGPVHILEEAEQNHFVPVTVQYACEESWTLLQQRPKLRLSLSMLCCC